MIRFKPLPYLLAGVSLLALPMAQAEELPEAIKAVEARGAEVVGRFEAPGGLKGYAARYNGQGMALYLTPDGEHVLIGSLLDAKGEDLTRAHLEKLVYEPLGKEMWTRMENSTWIADGKADAPRIIYMFSDPNCPYCNMFWKQAGPGSSPARCSCGTSWSACFAPTVPANPPRCSVPRILRQRSTSTKRPARRAS